MPRKGGVPENLKPFKKGNPGGGRPKGSLSLTTQLKKLLETDYTVEKNGKKITKPFGDWVNQAFIRRAMQGNTRAIELIYDRIEGKVANELKGKLDFNVKELTDQELEDIVNGK